MNLINLSGAITLTILFIIYKAFSRRDLIVDRIVSVLSLSWVRTESELTPLKALQTIIPY